MSFRASDLVMKVDALLSAQPKGDTRIKYQFFEDRHRYRISVEFVHIYLYLSSFIFPYKLYISSYRNGKLGMQFSYIKLIQQISVA